MKIRYRFESNDELMIRVDLERPESMVMYTLRWTEDDDWRPTPFQRADVRDEKDAWRKVNAWLEDQATN